MKKNNYLSIKLLVLTLMMFTFMQASAYDFMVDSICYNIIGENEVEVTKRDVNYSGVVIIPATVTNDDVTYHVTRIGRAAFRDCIDLTLVDIPEGVTVIDEWAFDGCKNLEGVEFPNSLVRIESFAFYLCYKITTLNITRNIEYIAYNAIHSCNAIVNFTCSTFNRNFCAVNGILYSKDMKTLMIYPQAAPATSFDIPSTVTRLHHYCLYNCDNLTQITIPESVTELGMDVFSGSDGIETIDIPNSVTKMGVSIVSSCRNLKYIHLPVNTDSILSSFFYNCRSLVEVTIPRSVKYIGTYAFTDCRNLKTINFEEGSCLNYIDLRAFEKCYALETFDMPNSITAIGYQIFSYCNSLKNVRLSDNLTVLPGPTFYYCESLTDLEIPSNITFIEEIAIDFCSSLRSLKIGDKDATPGTAIIDDYAVFGCDNLQRIELGANVSEFRGSALSDISSLKVFICWATTPPQAGYWSYYYAGNTTLYVPKASLEAYRSSSQWRGFYDIVPIEDVGDVDGDGTISIGDVTALIDLLLGGETDRAAFCDVNLDGDISIADVTALIDQLLGGN